MNYYDTIIQINIDDEPLPVELMCLLRDYDSGIGSYDYCGSISHDSYRSYELLECTPWDNYQDNEYCEEYIANNWGYIEEKAIERI